jgi:hypothetical protein
MARFETSIHFLYGNYTRAGGFSFVSNDIPDLCAIAETLTPPYEMVVYWGTDDASSIVEEWDEPGEKGNYGGFWHRPPLHQGVIVSWPDYLTAVMPDIHRR